MKKRILSTFLSLVLCLSLIPTAAFAEGAEGGNAAQPSDTDSNDYYTIGTPEDDVAAVQALIDALPTAETVTAADYDAVQDAYDAYDALTAEQQAQITGAEVFEALFAWFNGQPAPIVDSITYITADSTATIADYTEVTNSTGFGASGTFYVSQSLETTGDLSFTGNTTLILGSNATLTVNGVLSCTGNLTITTVTGATNTALTVTGGTRTDGNGYGFYAGGSLCIYAGTVDATGGNVTADSTNSYGIYGSYGSLIIRGDSTSVTATGGTAKSESYGIFQANGNNNDSISITDSTVNAFGGTATNISTGIIIRGNPLSISGNAKVTAKGGNTAETSSGIHCSEDLTISGNAEVTAESGSNVTEGYGIHGIKNVTINGGKVTATAGAASNKSYGIEAINGGVTITGGTVTATSGAASKESCGICAKSVSIADAIVTAYSDGLTTESHGISAGRSGNSISISQTAGKTTTLYGKDSGPVSLSAYDLNYNGGTLTLATDSTFTKSLSSSDSDRSFLSLLPAGYAFALRTTDGQAVSEITPKVGEVGSGTIVLKVCDHMNGDTSARENGICKYCGGAGALVKNSTTGVEYESFTLAYNAAKNGDTITLLADTVRVLSDYGDRISKNITLDLNGHTFSSKLDERAEATQIHGNVTIHGSSGTLASLEVCMNGEVTLDGGITVSKAVAGDGKLIVKNGVTVTDLEAGPGSSLQLSGGTFGKITRKAMISLNSPPDYSKTPTFAQMLAEDCGFYQTGEGGTKTWLSPDENTMSLSDVSVAKVPIKSVSLTASSNSVTYATLVNLTATVEQNGSDQIVYTWQEKSDDTWSELSVSTATYQVRPTVGTHIYRCVAAADGYTAISNEVIVTVTKGTVETNGPTANTGLIYNAQEQALVNAPLNLPSGTTMQYRLSPTAEWSNTIPKAKNADTYTVYWQVLGGDNYNDLTNTTPVTVTIEPNNIGNSMQMAIVVSTVPNLTYNGQSQTPSPVLKLQSKGDNGSAVTEYEELVKDRDYTVTVTPQTNVGNYELTITGKGNYTGTRTGSWSIEKANYGTPTATGSAKFGATGTVDLSNFIMPGGTAAASVKTDGSSVLDTYSIENDTSLQFTFKNNAGLVGETAEIEVSVTGCTNYNDYAIAVTVTVNAKTVPTVTAPAAKTLTYNGSDQTLITAGSTTGGTLQYSLDNSTWSAVLPTGTNAKTYTVYYRVVGDDNYADVAENHFDVTIGKKAVTVKPKSYTITKGNAIPTFVLEYVGLVNGDSLTASAVPTFTCYEADGKTAVSTSTAAGSYTITWTNSDDFDFTSESNYTVTKATTGTLTINNKSSSGGSSSSGSSNNTTITVPVSSDHASVEVKAEVSKGNATVEVSDKQIENVIADHAGEVTIDVSDLKNVESATVPSHVIEKTNEAENTGLTVALPAGSVTLDETALGSVTENANGKDVAVSVVSVPTEKLPTAVKEVIGMEPTVVAVVDVNVTIGGKKQSSFDGGKVTISVPYTPKKGEDTSKLTVWFIRDDGTIENKGGYYDAEKKCFVFETEHLSQYLLVNTNELVSFTDVPANAYYAAAVNWAAKQNITGGIGNNLFAPDASCTRAQIVTFLYRYVQSQGGGFTGAWMFQLPFSDVPEWCYESVAWCYMNNIVGGYGNGLFGSNDTITREQMAVILYRFAQETGLDTTQGGMAVREYSDYESISDYAVTAMQWAVNAGILQGYNNNLMPAQPCTRAQIVTMLYRLLGT